MDPRNPAVNGRCRPLCFSARSSNTELAELGDEMQDVKAIRQTRPHAVEHQDVVGQYLVSLSSDQKATGPRRLWRWSRLTRLCRLAEP